MYKIIASDLDGTLLTPHHVIASYTRRVLHSLHQRGSHFVFATGRHHHDVAGIRDTLGIPAYMITANGARIHDADNSLLYKSDVEPEVIEQAIEMVKDDDTVALHLFTDDGWLTSQEHKEIKAFFQMSGFCYQLFDKHNSPTRNIAKLSLTRRDHDYLTRYEKRFIEAFSSVATISFSSPWCLEITAAGVSKGAALKTVAELKGYTLEHCIAFGDAMNDREMLEMAGKGLIMASAQERLKAELSNHDVIGYCGDEAVASYLEKHILDENR